MVKIPIGPSRTGPTLFDVVGGAPFFDRLIERFYEGVESDPPLRVLYPEDLEPGKAHLGGFLKQFWGGPPDYSAERGHPRLRMRHAPFAIGQVERDAWVRHMTDAVHATLETTDLDHDDQHAVATALLDHMNNAATFLINR